MSDSKSNISATNICAFASLILSICFVFLGPLGSIPGIICGKIALREYKLAGISQGQGMAKAGIVIGWIGLALFIISVIVALIMYRQFSQSQEEIFDVMRSLPSR